MIREWDRPPGARLKVTVSAEIRARLIALARSRRTRRTDFVSNAPSRWSPTSITDPRTKSPFTEEGAWEYIIKNLEDGIHVEEVILEKPAGKKGYCLWLPSAFEQAIYVKLQICGD